jgi:hypothetical protein
MQVGNEVRSGMQGIVGSQDRVGMAEQASREGQSMQANKAQQSGN